MINLRPFPVYGGGFLMGFLTRFCMINLADGSELVWDGRKAVAQA